MARSRARRKADYLANSNARIEAAEANRVLAYIERIKLLDEGDKSVWSEIVSAAIKAGLEKEKLAETLSCNVLTINRWHDRVNAPIPMARKAIKAELISLLEQLAKSHSQHAMSLGMLADAG
jgi:DNA-binding transcriptional regulator YiaG